MVAPKPLKRTQAKQWTPASLESYSEKAIDKARGLERDAAMIVAGNRNEEEDFAARLGMALHTKGSDVKSLVNEWYSANHGEKGEIKLGAWRVQIKKLMPLSFAETQNIDSLFKLLDSEGKGRISTKDVKLYLRALQDKACLTAATAKTARDGADRLRQRAEQARKVAIAMEDAAEADERLAALRSAPRLEDASAQARAEGQAQIFAQSCVMLRKAATMQREGFVKGLEEDKAKEAAARRDSVIEISGAAEQAGSAPAPSYQQTMDLTKRWAV